MKTVEGVIKKKTCQAPNFFARGQYAPCGKPAEAVVFNGDQQPYFMCALCAAHAINEKDATILAATGHESFAVKSGDKVISLRPGMTPGRIWIEIETGEGGDFTEETVFETLRNMFEIHFES